VKTDNGVKIHLAPLQSQAVPSKPKSIAIHYIPIYTGGNFIAPDHPIQIVPHSPISKQPSFFNSLI
jgi:hypothetical protein